MSFPAPRPKAYSYIRFSSMAQRGGDSLRRQETWTRAYAEKNGLDLDGSTYRDLGISAFNRTNIKRGALAAFLRAVEDKTIAAGSYLLVEDLDRLSRANPFAAMNLFMRIVSAGIKIVVVQDGAGKVYDQNACDDMAVWFKVGNAFERGNDESNTKSVRVKAAHQQKRDARDPFAFGQGPGWLTPNPDKTGWVEIADKVESVQRVFRLTAQGFGSTYIAKLANQEGWPVPARADAWHKNLPNKLVHNDRVRGEFSPGIMVDGVRTPTGDTWTDYYPRVVSDELFFKAQAAAARRQALPKRRDNGYHNIFQGLIRCGSCGATLARKSKSGKKNSAGYALYVCADRERGLTKCPGWNARELEENLVPGIIGVVVRETGTATAQQAARDQLEVARTEHLSVSNKRRNLIALLEEREPGSKPSPEVVRLLAERDKSVEQLEEQIRVLSAKAEDTTPNAWEDDSEQAIGNALAAIADVTTTRAADREALRQSFLRCLTRIDVWPQSHAHITLHDDRKLLIPISEQSVLRAIDDAVALRGDLSNGRQSPY